MLLWHSKSLSGPNQQRRVQDNMSDLYAKYLNERHGDNILQTEHGFASYRYINEGKTVYLVDIYVVPEQRESGLATKLADTIAAEAKEKGCVEMLGTVVPSTRNSMISLKGLLSYGMVLSGAGPDIVIFRKDL